MKTFFQFMAAENGPFQPAPEKGGIYTLSSSLNVQIRTAICDLGE